MVLVVLLKAVGRAGVKSTGFLGPSSSRPCGGSWGGQLCPCWEREDSSTFHGGRGVSGDQECIQNSFLPRAHSAFVLPLTRQRSLVLTADFRICQGSCVFVD